MSKKTMLYGISLTVLGEVLYIVKEILQGAPSNFGQFAEGFLTGLAVGLNVIGIIVLIVAIVRNNRKE